MRKNWLLLQISGLMGLSALLISACGVKGPPLPALPTTPEQSESTHF